MSLRIARTLYATLLIPLLSSHATTAEKLPPLPRELPKQSRASAEVIALGKQLFFDPRLSGDNRISCGTCHDPTRAFADGVALNRGTGGQRLSRNSQSCLNVALNSSFFWDGRASSLEQQALGPIQSPVEMNQSLDELEIELRRIPAYVSAFQTAFGSAPNRDGVAKALAAYQRTLLAIDSPFDRFLRGDKDALTPAAKKGLELFQGDAGCIECHHGPLLSDGKFYRLGIGGEDKGRSEISGDSADRYRFRTPSLRNIAETAPYMHDGSLRSLDEVVTFYYRGIPHVGRDNLPPDVYALEGQSFSEIPNLVAFLKSLSGNPPRFVPPMLPSIIPSERETLVTPAIRTDEGVLVHTIQSPYQQGKTELRVLLPNEIEPTERLPVVFLLPVEAGRERRFGDALAEIIQHDLHNKYRAVYAAPTFAQLPWYADHPTNPLVRQETYFLSVIVPLVDFFYPTQSSATTSKGRHLLGFSKSGWGAWSLLLRQPDRFDRAAAWDAPLMMEQVGKYGNGPIFATQENFERYRIDQALTTARKVDNRLLLTGYGNFRDHHQRVEQTMQAAGTRFVYRDGPKRKHDWHSGWVAELLELLLTSQ